MPFFAQSTVATQQRIGAYSNNKASYASTGASFVGQFLPMQEQMAINLNLIGQGYIYNAPGNSDIQAGDILTIGGKDYHVRGVSRVTQAGIDYLRCTLVLTAKS